jgi:hypothetical protein
VAKKQESSSTRIFALDLAHIGREANPATHRWKIAARVLRPMRLDIAEVMCKRFIE